MSDTNAELLAAVKQLTAQLKVLDERIAKLEERQEIPEADLVAIGAAVAAFLGHKAKIRAVRFANQSRWAAASRGQVHDRTVPHNR
jgi:hypothetical protein